MLSISRFAVVLAKAVVFSKSFICWNALILPTGACFVPEPCFPLEPKHIPIFDESVQDYELFPTDSAAAPNVGNECEFLPRTQRFKRNVVEVTDTRFFLIWRARR